MRTRRLVLARTSVGRWPNVPLDQVVSLLDDPAQLLGEVNGLILGEGRPDAKHRSLAQDPLEQRESLPSPALRSGNTAGPSGSKPSP